jgi:hypothetical protein
MRTTATAALGLVLFTFPLHAQDRSRYRDFALGSKEAENTRLSQEKARLANKASFRP